MTVPRVSLFQTLRISTPDGRILDLGSPTTRSLLAYLILHRAQPIDRRRLAFLFWPRGTESAARRNLRQYLHRIRRALEPVDPTGEWVLADGNHIQFNPKISLWLDVQAFRRDAHPDASLVELQAAVSLYVGDLLEDLYEDWCETERQNLRQIYLSALERLVLELQKNGQFELALQYALKWVAVEPLDEGAHRLLMGLYTFKGERNRAIQHYQNLVETLAQELDTEPLPETQKLIKQIQTGEFTHENGHDLPVNLKTPSVVVARPAEAGIPPSPTKISDILKAIPIVGRKSELSQLHTALQNAWDDRGGFILITGESGIGKTRLVQEYLEQHQDLPTFNSACHELEAMQPFAPLRQVFQQAFALLSTLSMGADSTELADIASLADTSNHTALHRSSSSARLLPALKKGLERVQTFVRSPDETNQISEMLLSLTVDLANTCEPQPVQIILDDLHWADTPTWNYLAQLARRVSTHRLLVIGMCRLEDLPAERSRLIRSLERYNLLIHLPLRRLNTTETATLAGHLLSQPELDPIFLNRLYQETEGNPFFIIEIVLALRETGKSTSISLDSSSPRGSPALPISIQRVIEARLDRLAPESRELLCSAAAIGRAFTYSLLQEISQVSSEEIIRFIEEWILRGLIIENALGYDFSHDKIRQVAYANLSRARRQFIHRHIAKVLEAVVPPVDASTLAHHYARSDQPLKALPFLTSAGEQALQARSYLEARQFGQQAVSLLGRLPGPRQREERLELNLQLAQAYAFSGDLARAHEILLESEHLAHALETPPRLGELFHRMAQVLWLRGQPEAAGDYARRTLRIADELGKPLLQQAALRMLGRVGIALSAFDDAIAYLVRYTKLENSSASPPDLPIVFGYLGVAYSRVGSWARAFDSAKHGVALAERAAERESGTRSDALSQAVSFARMQLAFVYADHQEWDTCLQMVESASASFSSQDSTWKDQQDENGKTLTPLRFMLLGLRGLALAQLGEPRRGIETIRPALNWAEQTDYRVFHYLPRLFLTNCLTQAGEIRSARLEAERVLEAARSAGNRWACGVTLRLLAETIARHPAPDWAQVEGYLIQSMSLLRQVRARPDLARTYLALRKLYDRAGQIAWAVDCHFRATSIFEELGMNKELRHAQGQAASERRGAVVIPGLELKGPNVEIEVA